MKEGADRVKDQPLGEESVTLMRLENAGMQKGVAATNLLSEEDERCGQDFHCSGHSVTSQVSGGHRPRFL